MTQDNLNRRRSSIFIVDFKLVGWYTSCISAGFDIMS